MTQEVIFIKPYVASHGVKFYLIFESFICDLGRYHPQYGGGVLVQQPTDACHHRTPRIKELFLSLCMVSNYFSDYLNFVKFRMSLCRESVHTSAFIRTHKKYKQPQVSKSRLIQLHLIE